jgi:rod shape-determining protein MreC
VFANTANEVTGSLDTRYNAVEYYFRLKATNDKLAVENARLRNMLPSSFKQADSNIVTRIDSVLVDSSMQIRKFNFLPAKVVNNSISEENNFITLERGAKQGVAENMAVTGPDGIVGRVIFVSDNYSRVMSLLNHNSKVSAMLKNGSYNGIIDWDGKDAGIVLMHNIPKSAKVQKGDTVSTSTLSGSFPPGLIVGTVSEVDTDPSSNFFTLKVKTATNFYTLQYAYLIQNMMLEEQKKLELETPKN